MSIDRFELVKESFMKKAVHADVNVDRTASAEKDARIFFRITVNDLYKIVTKPLHEPGKLLFALLLAG